MSQAREMPLRQLAIYCHNHTDISAWDIVAFYSNVHIPKLFPYTVNLDKETSSLGENGFKSWCDFVKKIIDQIKKTDPEYYKDCYSETMQIRWEAGNRSSHYYCSRVCRDFE